MNHFLKNQQINKTENDKTDKSLFSPKGSSHSKKKKCEISHLGGGSGQNWVIFTLFFIFFLLCPKSCKSAKKFFSSMGGRVLGLVDEFQKWVSMESNESFWA